MLIELRCATHGGAREEVVPGNLNFKPNEELSDDGKQGVIVPISSAKLTPRKVKNKTQTKISLTRTELTKNSSLRVAFIRGTLFYRIHGAVVLTTTPNRPVSLKK